MNHVGHASAEAIGGLLRARERATTLGQRAREVIRAHYPLDREAESLAELYWSTAKDRE